MYDIIGDVHGHATALESLLRHLGYRYNRGAFRFPGNRRQVIFLGDFIDRGPKIVETLTIVQAMLDGGSASAVIGNHEYNALIWHTPDGKGGWLRTHTDVHLKQHRATLEQFGLDPNDPADTKGVLDGGSLTTVGARRLREELSWLRRLPLYLENDVLRVVHAAWSDAAVSTLEETVRGTVRFEPRFSLLDDTFLYRSAYGKYRESWAVEILLKGIEIGLPGGAHYRDKEGASRFRTRVRWWIDPATLVAKPMVTMADVAMPPADRELATLPVAQRYLERFPGYRDQRPVFFGHYWFLPPAAPVESRAACLDYSIARDGWLCAYRYDGEPVLTREGFTAVDAAGRVVQ